MPVSFRVIVGKLLGTSESVKTVEPVRKVEVKPAVTTTLTREPIPVGTPKGMELLLKEAQAPTRTKGLNTRMNTAILALEDDQVDSLLQQIDLDAAEAKPLREAIEKNGTLGRKELAELMNDDVLSGSLTSLSKDLIAHRCPFCKRYHFCKPGCCHCFCICRCHCKGPKGDKGDTGAQGPQGIQGPKGDKGDNGTNGANGVNGTNGATGATGLTGANGANGITFKIVNRKVTAVAKGVALDPPTNSLWSTVPFYHNMTEFSANANLDDIANTFSAHAQGWVFDLSSLKSFPIFLRPILSKDTSVVPNRLKVEFEVRCLANGTKPWDDAQWSEVTPLNEVHYTIIG